MNKALCIIPARGGSKGLRRKNLRHLGGKPLLAYAIATALASESFDHVMVSTEDEEIAAVAREYGASVPFLRPMTLADDDSSLTDVVNDVLRQYAEKGFAPEVVGTMLPTSPFRSSEMVRSMVQSCLKDTCRNASTVRRIPQYPIYMPKGCLHSCVPLRDMNKLHPGDYYRTYGVFQARKLVSHLKVEQNHIHVLEHPAEWVDIDTNTDLVLAEKIIARGMYEFDHAQ